MRLSYDESFTLLKERVDVMGDPQPVVVRPPRHDEEKMGPTIFRIFVEDVSMEELTVPGLYVGRSEIANVSFQRTDLHFSTFNWTDILDCDFSESDLSGADLRACRFERCNFKNSNLSGADLRGSSFEACSFEDAIMRGAKLRSTDEQQLQLTPAQRAEAIWSHEAPEPGGG